MILATGQPDPAPGLLRRLDAVARAAFPATGAALLLILASTPAGLPALGPGLALACVYFWTIFRPAAMWAPAVFALGLLQDLLSFAPLGQGILTLLLAHGVALRFRRFLARRSFVVVWLIFCLFALGVAALDYVLQVVLGWRIMPVSPALVQAGLAAGAYPAVAAVLTKAHEAMQRAEVMA
ncbi:rod shape-determining protein MreD [Roseomonas sp. OT10]|uniref:rod shape-determining protein MreD n=1 Tax=Roseomonas cutis TaxID=2897332 RepID=UPI001E3D2E42|nr:rod shape-determining protein MreD [Roseomonas sp. OT10]UFN49386.1 rod shape-determining protein MreD [Roseomonas sp. OT10]